MKNTKTPAKKNTKTPVNVPKRLYSVEEAAAYLGISPRTIYNRIGPKSKQPFPIRPKKFGRLPKFDFLDLQKYVDDL